MVTWSCQSSHYELRVSHVVTWSCQSSHYELLSPTTGVGMGKDDYDPSSVLVTHPALCPSPFLPPLIQTKGEHSYSAGKKMIDLRTVMEKHTRGHYSSFDQLLDDLHLMCNVACRLSAPNSQHYNVSERGMLPGQGACSCASPSPPCVSV